MAETLQELDVVLKARLRGFFEAFDKAKLKVRALDGQIQQLGKTYGTVQKQMSSNKLGQAFAGTARAARKASSTVVQSNAKVLKSFKQRLRVAERLAKVESRGFSSLASGKTRNFGDSFKMPSLDTQLTSINRVRNGIALTTAALAGLGAASVREFAQFEDRLVKAAAVAGKTSENFQSSFDRFESAAISAAVETRFTANEAAEALTFLAMAGQSTSTAIESLRGVTQLAAAGNMDLGTAADIVTNIMASYGKQASQLNDVNNTLVGTFTASNTTLQELGNAFKQAGSISKELGLEIEDVSAFLGLLGNAGIKAEDAGTGVKRSLTALLNTSPKATKAMQALGISVRDVQEKGFTGLLDKLELARRDFKNSGKDAAAFATAVSQVFQQRATPKILAALAQGSDKLREIRAEIERAKRENTVEFLEKKSLESLSGQLDIFKSNVSAAAIAIGKELAPAIAPLTRALVALLKQFVAVGGGKVAARILGLVVPFGVLATSVLTAKGAMLAFKIALRALGFAGAIQGAGGLAAAFKVLGSKVGFLSAAIPAAAVGLGTFTATMWAVEKATGKTFNVVKALSEAVEEATGSWEGFKRVLVEFVGDLGPLLGISEDFLEKSFAKEQIQNFNQALGASKKKLAEVSAQVSKNVAAGDKFQKLVKERNALQARGLKLNSDEQKRLSTIKDEIVKLLPKVKELNEARADQAKAVLAAAKAEATLMKATGTRLAQEGRSFLQQGQFTGASAEGINFARQVSMSPSDALGDLGFNELSRKLQSLGLDEATTTAILKVKEGMEAFKQASKTIKDASEQATKITEKKIETSGAGGDSGTPGPSGRNRAKALLEQLAGLERAAQKQRTAVGSATRTTFDFAQQMSDLRENIGKTFSDEKAADLGLRVDKAISGIALKFIEGAKTLQETNAILNVINAGLPDLQDDSTGSGFTGGDAMKADQRIAELVKKLSEKGTKLADSFVKSVDSLDMVTPDTLVQNMDKFDEKLREIFVGANEANGGLAAIAEITKGATEAIAENQSSNIANADSLQDLSNALTILQLVASGPLVDDLVGIGDAATTVGDKLNELGQQATQDILSNAGLAPQNEAVSLANAFKQAKTELEALRVKRASLANKLGDEASRRQAGLTALEQYNQALTTASVEAERQGNDLVRATQFTGNYADTMRTARETMEDLAKSGIDASEGLKELKDALAVQSLGQGVTRGLGLNEQGDLGTRLTGTIDAGIAGQLQASDIGSTAGSAIATAISSTAGPIGGQIGGAVVGVIQTAASLVKGAADSALGALFSDIDVPQINRLGQALAGLAPALGLAAASIGAVVLAALSPLSGAIVSIGAALLFLTGPIGTLAAGIALVSGALFGFLAVVGPGFLAIGAGLIIAAKETESFQRFLSALQGAMMPLQNALEPVFGQIISLAAILEIMAEAAAVFVDGFLQGNLFEQLFLTVKQVAIGALQLAVVLGHLHNFIVDVASVLAVFGDGLSNLSLAMETVKVLLVEGVNQAIIGIKQLFGIGDAADNANAMVDSQAAVQEALNAATSGIDGPLSNLANSLGKVDPGAIGGLISELDALTFQGAIDRGEELATSFDALNKSVGEALTNVPQGVKVAQQRFRAAGTGNGDFLGGIADRTDEQGQALAGLAGGVAVNVQGDLILQADNPAALSDALQDQSLLTTGAVLTRQDGLNSGNN